MIRSRPLTRQPFIIAIHSFIVGDIGTLSGINFMRWLGWLFSIPHVSHSKLIKFFGISALRTLLEVGITRTSLWNQNLLIPVQTPGKMRAFPWNPSLITLLLISLRRQFHQWPNRVICVKRWRMHRLRTNDEDEQQKQQPHKQQYQQLLLCVHMH